ncbi:SDR family oxidoreductase [Novosphingobium album (ex Liu et al. 2023)]|uniref:SDR family oxidoreductase n=1 Tax=Novosphingobium album (ex Liu et al. 2023) TaxID=3031130 RepID=A0ABT5WQ67_9SPHN|nr:SDR family oxidoreductase [Novosphingobium album (ex Liu et al. 2023)]MDE8652019.1 SDR family oxidoreductase [Novosphingobium album (ex Liu et al. 2023)]
MARYEDLAGRTALLAGGATLIGAELALAFARQGCNVVIADIDVAGGTAAAARCGDAGLFVETDVTSDSAIDACLAAARARFGGIDFLVNVTTSYLDDGLDTARETWLRAFDIGLVGGAMLASKLRDELAARAGAIVNFSSVSAHRAQAGRFVYPAIKAAVAQLTRSQALEFAPLGVRVNAVAPGWTWSNVMKALSGDDRGKVDRVGGPFHMPGRIADPGEITGAVLFLCSDAAGFITGTELAVDGGYLAMGPEQATSPIAALVGG